MGSLLRDARVEVVVDVPLEAVWAVAADPTRVGEWSHETHGAEWVGGATGPVPGARFRGRNATGRSRWSRTCEVLPGGPHELVWRTVPKGAFRDSTEWRLRVEPAEGGTRIVQTFHVLALGPVSERLIWRLVPQHRDRRPALEDDLRRLGEVAARTASPTPA